MVVDSESYSDLDPSQAPEWSVAVRMADKPVCLLAEYLSEFLQLCSSTRSMVDLLGDLLQYQQPGKQFSNMFLKKGCFVKKKQVVCVFVSLFI